jgi:Fur family transcriptional regulator, ferric uptake regulator
MNFGEEIMRTTSINLFIIDTLEHDHSHLSAQQIFERVREHLPAVNPSTVYRALERLAHAGKVSVSDMGLGATLYESVSNKLHHHLVCQECKRIFTIENPVVQTFFDEIERTQHFQITTNHLILFGICEDCQSKLDNG